MKIEIDTPVDGALIGFTRNDGAYLDLPCEFIPHIPGMKRNNKPMDRAGSDGATRTGDGYREARTCTIKYNPTASEPTEYADDSLDVIEQFFARGQEPFYLIDHQMSPARRARVFIRDNSLSEREGLRRIFGKSSISLVMQDALFEDEAETVEAVRLLTTGLEWTFTNTSREVIYPVFELSPTTANINQFYLENITADFDGGLKYVDQNLITGSTLIISSVNDAVMATIGSINTSARIAQGGPIKLVPGVNTLRYVSSAGDLNCIMKYRLRYAH